MYKYLTHLMCLLLLAGCVTKAQVINADNDTIFRAKTFKTSPGSARVYFVGGKLIGNLFGMRHSYSSDIYINSVLIGSMNKDDVMVFELKPGVYNFSWNVRSTDPIDKKSEPQIFEYRLGEGDIVVLRGDYDLGGAGSFGLIGSMFSPPKTEIKKINQDEIQNRNVVLPQNCPEKVCLKW